MSSDGNPLSQVPPWAYLLVILGGGTFGGLQFGGQSAPVQQIQEFETCEEAETRAKDALLAWRGMVESYGLILQQLNQCHSGEGE